MINPRCRPFPKKDEFPVVNDYPDDPPDSFPQLAIGDLYGISDSGCLFKERREVEMRVCCPSLYLSL